MSLAHAQQSYVRNKSARSKRPPAGISRGITSRVGGDPTNFCAALHGPPKNGAKKRDAAATTAIGAVKHSAKVTRDKWGNYDGGEFFDVPIPKEAEVRLRIQIADVMEFRKKDKERWIAAIDLDIDCGPGGCGGSLMDAHEHCPESKTKGFPTRAMAIDNACEEAIEHLKLRRKQFPAIPVRAKLNAAIEAIRAFIGEQGCQCGEKASQPESLAIVPAQTPCLEAGLLTPTDRKKLDKCEQTIEKNIKGYVETGLALATIHNERLYRETHETFEHYCRERWEFGRQYAYRLISAAEVAKDISAEQHVESPIGTKLSIPATESQARPLVRLTSEQRPKVWGEIVETAPLAIDGQPRITAEFIEETVRAVLGEKAQPGRKAESGKFARGPQAGEGGGTSDFEKDVLAIQKRILTIAAAYPPTKRNRDRLCKMLRDLAKRLEVR